MVAELHLLLEAYPYQVTFAKNKTGIETWDVRWQYLDRKKKNESEKFGAAKHPLHPWAVEGDPVFLLEETSFPLYKNT